MKMILKSNLLENLCLFSSAGTFMCIVLNSLTNISPIGSPWFAFYVSFLLIASLFFSIKFMQWLLNQNKPLKYDLDRLVVQYPYLNYFLSFLPNTNFNKKKEVFKEYDTNELSIISTVLEKKLVSSWYVPYISEEISFPFACKQMLDQMIGKMFQICNKIETKEVFVDICTILSSHLWEYRKALKRQNKTPNEKLESLYKKSHVTSDCTRKLPTTEHCTNILRIILKELIPWELWDTPHSELLVRILSKKLDSFIDSSLTDPVWLNDKLLTLLKVEDEKSEKTVSETAAIPVEKSQVKPETEKIEKDTCQLKTNIVSQPTSELEEPKENIIVQDNNEQKLLNGMETVPVIAEQVDVKTSPVLRQRRGRQGRSEVKIYDRVIEGSVKTWETDMDLQCISLGQDLLASLDGEITLSRLWGQEGSPNPPRAISPQPLWFEDETLDMELGTSPPKDKRETSPKATEALLKDIQTTVREAKTKIGDLQVRNNLDGKRNCDEAAGMMEGLLDFGIAGLKKGLRFTGLSDDSQDKSPSHQRHRNPSPDKGDRTPPEKAKDVLEHREGANVFRDENSSTNHPLLKQQRVISQDSVPSQPRPILRGAFPPPEPPLSDSPEPQYEEVADLSTSIARLRSLLQQRDHAQRNEEVWWESAEETRGHTQAHHSSRPVDSATLADEYDMNMEKNSSPGQMSNNMQRLDKLFQRTVTGVFNSIKTAVGAEGEAPAANTRDWVYVCTSMEHSVGSAVARLVGARKAYTHVDAALDSLEQLHPPRHVHIPTDDFEEWCSEYSRAWCGLGAMLGAASLSKSHLAHRAATTLCADLFESLITIWLDELTAWLKKQIFSVFQDMSKQEEPAGRRELRRFDIDQTCSVIVDKARVLHIFGSETLNESVKLSVSSFSHKELNQDVMFRVLDLFVLHFKNSAAIKNPSFDSN